jgi:hypothetical protein
MRRWRRPDECGGMAKSYAVNTKDGGEARGYIFIDDDVYISLKYILAASVVCCRRLTRQYAVQPGFSPIPSIHDESKKRKKQVLPEFPRIETNFLSNVPLGGRKKALL